MSTTETPSSIRWTLVTRRKGQHFYRPVHEAGDLSWHEASEIGRLLAATIDDDSVQVFVTVDERDEYSSSRQWDEDRANILEVGPTTSSKGRRVPIRWGAAPDYFLDSIEGEVPEDYTFGETAHAIRSLAELRAERGVVPVVVPTRVEAFDLIPGQSVAVVLYYGEQMVGNRCALVGGMSDEERAARIRETAEKLAAHVGVELTEEAAA